MALSGIALVTGGAGFIGSHLAAALIDQGARVRIIDNLSTGYRENIAEIGGKVDFIEGSITDTRKLGRALQGVELVFHEAAIPSVPRSVEKPAETHEASINATFSLLLAARDCKVRRVIYAASSSAYGDRPELPKREDMRPDPLSPYAVAKLVGEYYCQVFTRVYGLETVSLRYFNVFGPRQDPSSQYSGVISRFISALMNAEQPVIYGDGEQSRDFTYIANGERVTINDLFGTIKKLTGRIDARVKHAAPRTGDVRDSLADLTLARSLLGYKPHVGLEEGLRLTLDWWKSSRFRKAIANT